MYWFLVALVSAILFAVSAVLSKELMENTSPMLFTSIFTFLSALFYTPFFIYYFAEFSLTEISSILTFVLLSVAANTLGLFLYNTAIKTEQVSIVMPLNRFQPVFVAIIGFIFLNEVITTQIGTGIILVTLGGYLVLLKDHSHFKVPINHLVHSKGAQFALLSALAFSISAVSDRYVTTQIAPEIHTFLILTTMALLFNTYLIQKNGGEHISQVKQILSQQKILYILLGITGALSYLTVYLALSLAEASKVIPVLQIQVPLAVLAGGALFHEENILLKIIGSLILIAGVALIAI